MLSPELLKKERFDEYRQIAQIEANEHRDPLGEEESSSSGEEGDAHEEFDPEDEICL
jgi:hypothetical protein